GSFGGCEGHASLVHDERGGLHVADAVEGIAIENEDVGHVSRRDRTEAVRHTEPHGWQERGAPDDVDRFQPARREMAHLGECPGWAEAVLPHEDLHATLRHLAGEEESNSFETVSDFLRSHLGDRGRVTALGPILTAGEYLEVGQK